MKQDLYLLLHDLRKKEQGPEYGYILTHKTPEGREWWQQAYNGQRPDIPAASIEDLRKAGMMPGPFYCENSESTAGPCAKQCAECAVDEQAERKPEKFYCIDGESDKKQLVRCYSQCVFCKSVESDKSKPSITLEDYARMEAEHEAITSPAHYKVCEGLDVVDMIRAVLTPEQFSGYCLGNLIKYRMRAGKKTMSPMEDLGKAHVYETWLAEMEGGEG
jgi:hypothetical protein